MARMARLGLGGRTRRGTSFDEKPTASLSSTVRRKSNVSASVAAS